MRDSYGCPIISKARLIAYNYLNDATLTGQPIDFSQYFFSRAKYSATVDPFSRARAVNHAASRRAMRTCVIRDGAGIRDDLSRLQLIVSSPRSTSGRRCRLAARPLSPSAPPPPRPHPRRDTVRNRARRRSSRTQGIATWRLHLVYFICHCRRILSSDILYYVLNHSASSRRRSRRSAAPRTISATKHTTITINVATSLILSHQPRWGSELLLAFLRATPRNSPHSHHS